MKPALSEAVKELIKKARIVSFSGWEATHPPEIIPLFQAADDQGRYLTDEDFQQIQNLSPATSDLIPVAKLLRDRVTEIVDEAREVVLTTFPDITQPGGGLYPAPRAEACWRDFWHFLRCITYGIAGQNTEYTSDTGLEYMKLLYLELQVPLDAMVVGLEGIKTASLKRIEAEQGDAIRPKGVRASVPEAYPLRPIASACRRHIAPYFDHLIEQLKSFQN
ncbi:MAG TPA: phycobilisome protein [Cyanobacteria bacterium UBA11369]|nr:phycobilisome protein [Cyanobacteria bacterium UBA11371]HBE33740.1 phycobilisome protein [Cyanobacteria bacterium UBA11368]HBE53533.1 phycobilisome protein [Cyanobacteria bacterium UBA11369]